MAKQQSNGALAEAPPAKPRRQRRVRTVSIEKWDDGKDAWVEILSEAHDERTALKAVRLRAEPGEYRVIRELANVTVKVEQVAKVTLE